MQSVRTSTQTLWLGIVLGFALVVAVIAIPNLKLARMTVNESAAKHSLHIINSAQAKFSASNPGKGYACTLPALGEARLIPDSLASGKDKGYVFEILDCGHALPNGTYRAFAHPLAKNETGDWLFCTDQTASVRASPESQEDCLEQGVAQR